MYKKGFLSITEAANKGCVTRQAVYISIRKGRLKAHKGDKHWWISPSDYQDYQNNKYSREFSKDENGKNFYCPDEGRYSPNQVAELLGEPTQYVYFRMRTGQMKYVRNGERKVILWAHLQEYMKRSALHREERINVT